MFMVILKSIVYFVVAGFCEIGGGYLIWQWIRAGKSAWLGVVGAFILVLYGLIPTLQPSHFGRVYAAYGGVFIVLSLLWGNYVDKIKPDRYDILGAGICLIGITIIMYWPRSVG
jgi:small multidrug resistance family-3 protein